MSLEGQEVWKRILQWGGQKTRSYTLQLREHNKRKENEKSKMRRREINRGKVKRGWKAGYSKIHASNPIHLPEGGRRFDLSSLITATKRKTLPVSTFTESIR